MMKNWTVNDGGCQVVFTEDLSTSLQSNLPGIAAPMNIYAICSPSQRSIAVVQSVIDSMETKYNTTIIAKGLAQVPVELVDETFAVLPDPSITPFMFLAVGGGGVIGLAKSLSLRFESGIPIAVIPTTYSGSEMTNIAGILTSQGKKTVRDDRARPKLVLYDATLVQSMPKAQAVSSACNALAHAVEALWDSTAAPTGVLMSEEAVRAMYGGLTAMANPETAYNDLDICHTLLYGSYLCGSVLNSHVMGVHHKLAHVLGGRFHLPHADVHTVLLPHTLFFNSNHAPVAMNILRKVMANTDPAGALFDLQKKLEAPTSLRALKFAFEDIEQSAAVAVAEASEPGSHYRNPRPIDQEGIHDLISAAFHANRPCARVVLDKDLLPRAATEAKEDLAVRFGRHGAMPVSVLGADLDKAEIVIVCVHGRFASANRIIQQLEEVTGVHHASGKIAVIAPMAAGSNWYPGSFLEALATNEPNFTHTMNVIDACVRHASQRVTSKRVFLFAFSQGACSAVSYATRPHAPPLGGVFVCSGALCGSDDEVTAQGVYPALACKDTPFVLGCAMEDAHVPASRVQVTAALLRRAAASVQCDLFPGTSHQIFPKTASKIRCLLSETLHGTVGNSTHDPYEYLGGYQSLLETEALPDAVPKNQRSPRFVKYNLVAEIITGSPFCAPRATNMSTWFYRIHPSVGTHGAFRKYPQPTIRGDFCCPGHSFTPEPVRWNPLPNPAAAGTAPIDFVDGLVTLAGTGNPFSVKGMAIHTYSCNVDMIDRSFYNSDGDLLIVPELGPLRIQTECGMLLVSPGELFILPKGLKMTVTLPANGGSKGFVAELFEIGHFQLPNLGPIGSNGLADARHFKTPTAHYEDRSCKDYELINKFGGDLFLANLQYSPYDVVGWSGRYHPCKYDLLQFMALGSVTWDHADPSLHTVLSCPIDPATAASACDIVCFRARYDAVQHTFRPPWYHRNAATEFNAIIEINAPYSGFNKGTHWLTPTMTGHGIAGSSFNGFSNAPPSDEAMMISEGSIWIMFESIYPMVRRRNTCPIAILYPHLTSPLLLFVC